MKPAAFEYRSPTSIDEAVSLLEQHGDECKILAGGQSLIPMMAFRLAAPRMLVDLHRIPELRYLDLRDGHLAMGAMSTHRAVEKMPELAERCALLAEAVEVIGHAAIRNRGTVGGSIAHADPSAEWPAALLALNGECQVSGPNGTRAVAGKDLYLGFFSTVLEPDELITEVRVELPQGRVGSAFLELARRHGDFAIAGVGSIVGLGEDGSASDVRLALMGAASTPVRARNAERTLIGHKPTVEGFEAAAEAIEDVVEPVSDMHGSSEFRTHVAKVLTKRALQIAVERAGGG